MVIISYLQWPCQNQSILKNQQTTNLKLLKDKVGDVFGSTPGTISKWIKRIIGGGATAGTGAYVGSRVEKAKQMQKAKGGYVKMKKGGSVKKSSYKKSRGTGAAKRGTKFKGVF